MLYLTGIIRRIKNILRTLRYAVIHEDLRIVARNILKFLPWRKHPSRLIVIGDLQTQLEYLYVTPIKIHFKGWATHTHGIKSVVWEISGEVIAMDYPKSRRDIAYRFMVPNDVGYNCWVSLKNTECLDFSKATLTVVTRNGQSYTHTMDISPLIEESLYEPTQEGVVRSRYLKPTLDSFDMKQKSVDIIIPFRDEISLLEQLLKSIGECTSYTNYKIILLDNDSSQKETEAYIKEILNEPNIIYKRVDMPFNYAKIINIGLRASQAEYCLLLNNDIEIITSDWLTMLVSNFEDSAVRIIGPKLLFPDYSIQHAGVVLGSDILTRHVWVGYPSSNQDLPHVDIKRKVSAVTGACMLIRKEDVVQYGGLDERLAVTLNDIDYCLKILNEGGVILYDPLVELIHHESYSRGKDDPEDNWDRTVQEVALFKNRWMNWLKVGDPYQ